jgi:hypothetical protein
LWGDYVEQLEEGKEVTANKALQWTGIPLRSIPASELGR